MACVYAIWKEMDDKFGDYSMLFNKNAICDWKFNGIKGNFLWQFSRRRTDFIQKLHFQYMRAPNDGYR